MDDFTKMSDLEVAHLLEKNAGEMDADVSTEEILEKVSGAKAEIVKSQYGVAVVQPELTRQTEPGAFLWLLYMTPAKRGVGHGSHFVKDILLRYRDVYQMQLICFGGKRASFFSRHGFKAIDRFEDKRIMETWR